MKLPGVRSSACPPAAGTEYKWGQPSRYDMKTSRLPAAQWRFAPPRTRGSESASVSPLIQTSRAVPLAGSPTQIAHGDGGSSSGDRGTPPRPGWRTNAIALPSGDHVGTRSRDVDGARYRIG